MLTHLFSVIVVVMNAILLNISDIVTCGQHLHEDEGSIVSPEYMENGNCVWTITVTKGMFIRLAVWINMEPALQCLHDFLMVRPTIKNKKKNLTIK